MPDGSVRRFLETRHRRLYHRDDRAFAASGRPGTLPSALQLVRKVGDYLDAAGLRPVQFRKFARSFRTFRGAGCTARFTTCSASGPSVPAPQAALRHSFRPAGQQSCGDHGRAGRHPARLHRARTLLTLLSFAVRRISVRNAGRPSTPRTQEAGPHFAGRFRSASTPIIVRIRKAGRRPEDSRRRYGPAAVREQQPADLGRPKSPD